MEIKVGGSKPQVTVVLGETRYPLRRPKVKESRHFEQQVKLAKDGGVSYFDLAADFLSTLGLPKEVYEEMETADVEEVLTTLSGDQKKT